MSRRILLVSSAAPWPTTSGGAQRTAHLYTALSRHGQVDLFLVGGNVAHTPAQEARLRAEYGLVAWVTPSSSSPSRASDWLPVRARLLLEKYAEILAGPARVYAVDARVRAALRAALQRTSYDLVVGRYLRPTAVSGALACSPLLIDMDDLDTALYATQLTAAGYTRRERIVAWWHLQRMRRLLPALLRRAAVIWHAAPEDAREIRGAAGVAAVRVLPNLPPYLPIRVRPTPESHVILMVGTLHYNPNVFAVDEFLRVVWTTVHARRPEARFRIVGLGMTDAMRQRWSAVPGVEPAGYVADLEAEYAGAQFAVAPIFDGSGTKVKVLEALAHGRACVVTPHSHRGYRDTLPSETITLRVATLPDMVDACVTLLDDPRRCEAMGRAGAEAIRTHFSVSRFEAEVAAALALPQVQAGIRLSGDGGA
jgi:glycosyltransferase involved in cell wall biosynthesis